MSELPLCKKADEAASSPNHPSVEECRKRRILRVVTAAFCVFLFLQYGMKLVLLQYLIQGSYRHGSASTHHNSSHLYSPSDGCIQESDWSHSRTPLIADSMKPQFVVANTFESFATLNVPITSEDFAFTTLNFNSRQPGTFRMITSPNQAKDSITFNISASYQASQFHSLNSVRICASSQKHMKGIEIGDIASLQGGGKISSDKNLVRFDTTLILPEPKNKSIPLSIRGFHSYTTNTEQSIGDLGSQVLFRRVHMMSHGSKAVEVKSLSADSIAITSIGGPIRGTFNTSAGLSLATTNSPILVDVNINSTRLSNPRGVPYFMASTTNSPIRATLSLYSTSSRPAFSVSGKTTNSPVEFTFKTAPLDTKLGVTAETTNSPAVVNAHPTFEGAFALSATILEPEINEDTAVVDPSGKGRQRMFQYNIISPGRISGSVFWGEEPKSPNPYPMPFSETITISTTNSPAILNL